MDRRTGTRWIVGLGLGLLLVWAMSVGQQLYQGAQRPKAEAILMLGGSIRREMYLAEQVAQGLDTPILISQGSPDPCIKILFERAAAATDQVWLETCAQSTFDNFRYGWAHTQGLAGQTSTGGDLSHPFAPRPLVSPDHAGQPWPLGRHGDRARAGHPRKPGAIAENCAGCSTGLGMGGLESDIQSPLWTPSRPWQRWT
jgi:hypothetical protein